MGEIGLGERGGMDGGGVGMGRKIEEGRNRVGLGSKMGGEEGMGVGDIYLQHQQARHLIGRSRSTRIHHALSAISNGTKSMSNRWPCSDLLSP